jgi:hypothetical protein
MRWGNGSKKYFCEGCVYLTLRNGHYFCSNPGNRARSKNCELVVKCDGFREAGKIEDESNGALPARQKAIDTKRNGRFARMFGN